MTIISNNCSAANTYKLNNIPYNHPFMWCINDFRFHNSSYFDWFVNFYNWNYENVEFGYNCNYDQHIKKLVRYCYSKVDNKCITYYMHYILGNEEKIEKLSRYSKDILNYCKEKYYHRISRMKKEKIYFLIDMYRSYFKSNCEFSSVCVPDNDLIKLSQYDNVYCYTSNLKEDEHVRDCFKSNNLIILDTGLNDSAEAIAKDFTIKKYEYR